MGRISFFLAGIVAALIVVGLVSGTFLRHLEQVVPIMVTFYAAVTKKKWAAFASISIFIFWLVIMIFIWLFLLHIANVINGHFSTTEIILTVIIGLCSAFGLFFSLGKSGMSLKLNGVFFIWDVLVMLTFMYLANTIKQVSSFSGTLKLLLPVIVVSGLSLWILKLLQKHNASKKTLSVFTALLFMLLQVAALTISYL